MTAIEVTNVREVYNKIAGHFDSTRTYKWRWVTEFVESLEPGSTIYDIGCGSGRNMTYKNLNFIGVDNCEQFISICEGKGLSVVNADMTKLPFQSNSANAILCIASFHHLSSNERRIAALNEITRVLKPRGKVLLSVWSIRQPAKTKRKFETYGSTIVKWKHKDGKEFNRFYYIFKIDEIKELFKVCGLTVLDHSWETGNEVFTLIA